MAGIRGRDGEGRNGYGEAGRFAWRRISGYAATAEPSPAKISGERRDCEGTEWERTRGKRSLGGEIFSIERKRIRVREIWMRKKKEETGCGARYFCCWLWWRC